MQLVEAHGGIVEVRNGLMEGFCREIGQLPLKMAESQAGIVEILGALRLLQTDSRRNKLIHPPIFTLCILMVSLALIGQHQMHRRSGVFAVPGNISGGSSNVLHQLLRLCKNLLIDLLQNIICFSVAANQICLIDMALTVALTGFGAALDLEF